MAEYIKEPIDRKLEQYLSIHHGVVFISPDNKITLKLFLQSEIDVNIDKVCANIEILNKSEEKVTISQSNEDIEIKEGEVIWEFTYDCVRETIFFLIFSQTWEEM